MARIRWLIKQLAMWTLLALMAVAAAFLLRDEAGEKAGVAVVNDGDSITMNGERMRLSGIDALEFNQTCKRHGETRACGREAARVLRRLIGDRTIFCRHVERDRYERLLVKCDVDGQSVNRQMVLQGWAVAYGDFHAEERQARANKRGLWAGSFELPSDWRRQHRLGDQSAVNWSGHVKWWLEESWRTLQSWVSSTSEGEGK
jgi:endonuclease YncB( thermonuclease family)